jgi:hypothetical protein
MIKNMYFRDTGHRLSDIINLPEPAQQELSTFCEFLIFKYQRQETLVQREKRRILSTIFQEANGKLPLNYIFDREKLHER